MYLIHQTFSPRFKHWSGAAFEFKMCVGGGGVKIDADIGLLARELLSDASNSAARC